MCPLFIAGKRQKEDGRGAKICVKHMIKVDGARCESREENRNR